VSGIAGLLAIPVVLKGSKESGRFTKVAEERKANGSSYWKDLSSLLSDRRYRKHVLIGMIPPFCNLTILWAFLTLLPPYVMQEMGYSLNSGMSWFIVTNFVVIFGFLAWGPVADNLGRKIAFLIFGTIAAITLPLCLLWSPNIVWFYVLSSIAYASTEAVYSGIVTYLPELFPTKIRSTAVAITNQTGRILSSFMPLLVGILATNIGTASALSWLSVVWVLMIVLFIFGPETKGRSLEELTEG
jgi:MFS family permease